MSAVDKLHDADLEIREALPDDAHAIAALYVWHVLNGRASFEEIPQPSTKCASGSKPCAITGCRGWCAVARHHRRLLLRHLYRPRPAYRYTLEESIYVEAGMGDAASAAPCSRG
jgi:phosphinothricin acetyltransferase